MASIPQRTNDVSGASQWCAGAVIHDLGGAGPIYAAVTGPGGRRFFSDEFHHRVVIEDPSGCRWSFGTEGSAAGQFQHPRGLALLPGTTLENCRLFVCDAWNHRVQVFDGHGRFLLAFGAAGNGAGQFDVPSDVAIVRPVFPGEDLDADSPDAAWLAVADRWNNRVQIFETDGTYVGTLGGRGRVTGSIPGAPGTSVGWPFFRVGVDPATWFPVRLVWAAPHLEITSANGRVLRVDLALALLPDFDTWRKGASREELLAARAHVFRQQGTSPRVVSEVIASIDTEVGRAALAAEQPVEAARSWSQPWPAGLSPRSVEAQLEARLETLEMRPERLRGADVERRLLRGLAVRIRLARRASAREAAARYHTEERSAAVQSGTMPAGWSRRDDVRFGVQVLAPPARLAALAARLTRLRGVPVAQASVAWTVPPGEGDLQGAARGHGRLAVLAAAEPALWLFDESCVPLGRFALPAGTQPRGIAPAPCGGWYITDVQHDCLLHVSGEGRIVGRWGGRGERPDGLRSPLGLAAARGRVLIADRDNDRVEEYNAAGRAVGGYARLPAPTAVAVDRDGLWVAGWRSRSVQYLARRTGEILVTLRHADLAAPIAVALAGSRLILVADHLGIIHAFTRQGGWLGALWLANGQPIGRLRGLVTTRRHGVAVDHEHGQLLRFALPEGGRPWQR